MFTNEILKSEKLLTSGWLAPHMLIAMVCHHRIQENPTILLLYNNEEGYFIWKQVFNSHKDQVLRTVISLQTLFLCRSLCAMFNIVLKKRETQWKCLHSKNISIMILRNSMGINLYQCVVHLYMALQHRQTKKNYYHCQPSSDLV